MSKESTTKTITLNTIGDVVSYLSDSVNRVSSDVSNINMQVDEFQNQINDMKNNVVTLEDEVRTFMNEMKQSVLVSNAKQSIMLSQMEYEKKFSHRDDVRRRIIGILQSIDINAVKKDTMETISEETIVNNPDYWLAPALVALCYWYTDNKKLAEVALKKALDRSEEKTAFLFCLIHLRANRINTAIKWLNKYLSLQDPTDMDCKIILLLDALSSGVFDMEVTKILLNQIQTWRIQLNSYPQYGNAQVAKWENYFREKDLKVTNEDNYINKFVIEKDEVNNVIHFSDFHIHMMNEFKSMLNDINYNSDNHLDKIDKLVNMLIFDYEEEELKLKMEILKSDSIINSQGLKNNSNENYLYNYNKGDFYTHISNICLNDNIFDIGIHTKKMAIALSKDYIISAYQKICNPNANFDLINLNIVLDDWIGTTKNGSDELKLKEDLIKHIEGKYQKEIDKKPLFDKLMLISIVAGILLSALLYKQLFLSIPIIILVAIFNGYMFFNNYKYRQNKINSLNQEKKVAVDLLMCIISEIVDYYFIYEESNKSQDEFIKYLDSLNYYDYIQTYKDNNKRNLIIGGKNYE